MKRIALIFASSFGFSKNPADNSLDIFLSSKERFENAKAVLENFNVPHGSLSGSPPGTYSVAKNIEPSKEHKKKRVRRKCTYVLE
ncbi:Oidioi.mRNA.OKI2018_I69.chr1.g1103.t1.cds [Oikopleura dioica]|uniref:Oidioi.mRNA.OKI2018_I69.chr1.g1103.t1.cds n=1 Tax=Oikopleura dioica TaxID=34765 RepID=A0ABN7SRX2_OIKDI|nr:Oidioi.mRNA.OKI2018_I69.chr1.g1103.t1.cds [Oikopleura dioica]